MWEWSHEPLMTIPWDQPKSSPMYPNLDLCIEEIGCILKPYVDPLTNFTKPKLSEVCEDTLHEKPTLKSQNPICKLYKRRRKGNGVGKWHPTEKYVLPPPYIGATWPIGLTWARKPQFYLHWQMVTSQPVKAGTIHRWKYCRMCIPFGFIHRWTH